MTGKQLAIVAMWGLISAIIGAVVAGILFGWRNASGGVDGGVIGGTVGAGIGGAWTAYSSIKKKRQRAMGAR